MALNYDGERGIRESRDDIERRFGIAQDGAPNQEQLGLQSAIRFDLCDLAQTANYRIADSRAKSLALTHLEEALMWFGKAIFEEQA